MLQLITSKYAQHLFNQGHDVFLCPSKLSPQIFKALKLNQAHNACYFDDLVFLFKKFNCTSSITGHYVHYYCNI